MGRSDICLKRYLSDESRFADLINGVIGEGEQLVTATDLTDMDSQVGCRDSGAELENNVPGVKKRQWQGYRLSPLLPPETPQPSAVQHGCPWAPSHIPVLGHHLLCRLWPGILG